MVGKSNSKSYVLQRVWNTLVGRESGSAIPSMFSPGHPSLLKAGKILKYRYIANYISKEGYPSLFRQGGGCWILIKL
jgi:hypothetical protein